MIPQQNVRIEDPSTPTMPRTPVVGMNVQTFPCWVDLQEIRKRTNSNSKRQMPYKTDTPGDTDHYGIAVGYPVFAVDHAHKPGGRAGALQTLNGLVLDDSIITEVDLLRRTQFLGIAHTSNRAKKLRNGYRSQPTAFDVAYFGKVTLINHTFTPPVRDINGNLLKGSCRGVSVKSGDMLTIGFFPFNKEQTIAENGIEKKNVDPTKEDYYKFWYKNVDAGTERIVPIWHKYDEYNPVHTDYLKTAVLDSLSKDANLRDTALDEYKKIFGSERHGKLITLFNDLNVKVRGIDRAKSLKKLIEYVIATHGKDDVLSRRVHFKVLSDTGRNSEVKFGKEMVGVITMCNSN